MSIGRLKLIGILIYLIASFPSALAFGSDPIIKAIGDEHIVVLSDNMEKALRNYDPEFTVWSQRDYIPDITKGYPFSRKQAPFAVIGDFNGDRILDVVLQGHNKKEDLIICLMSDSRKLRVMEIERGPLTIPQRQSYDLGPHTEYGQWIFLTFVAPGKIESPYEDNPLELKTDAFELNYFEKASVVYYFKRGQFHKYITGD
jgi:hypothetical protein